MHFDKERGLHGDATDPIEARLETDEIGNPRWSWRPVNESELERVAALLKDGLNPNQVAGDGNFEEQELSVEGTNRVGSVVGP